MKALGSPGTAVQAGPLTGVQVVDVSALGPGPFASMILADFGADVIEIRRPQRAEADAADHFARGKKSLTVDLASPGGPELVARLADAADVFLEGYRPGAMERRGLGPDDLMRRNPRLVYARLTGWGQDGPYAQTAGHDINYVAIAGVLGAIGVPGDDRPAVPLNLIGDLAGGSMSVVLGIVMALLARTKTGSGQIVDAAMVDGAAYLLSSQLAGAAAGQWSGRGTGMLSGAAPFYGVYRCADDGWMSLGAIEARFYREALRKLGIDPALADTQHDRSDWPRARAIVAAAFRSRTRDHWAGVLSGSDACAYPVLEPDEVAGDSHVAARHTVNVSGLVAPAPRLSGTPGRAGQPVNRTSTHALLRSRGLTDHEIEELRVSGALH